MSLYTYIECYGTLSPPKKKVIFEHTRHHKMLIPCVDSDKLQNHKRFMIDDDERFKSILTQINITHNSCY